MCFLALISYYYCYYYYYYRLIGKKTLVSKLALKVFFLS